MKTPRLALIAFLALASATAANAALPTWTVVDEGYRDWPTITFKVGNGHKSLRCRYAECNPEKQKGQSNLYVMKQFGATEPRKATIYRYVERSKWNPRYYTDGPYDKVPEIIDSIRTHFTTELSNFKLDNSGKELVVVQGANKYPATTDIYMDQVSASGSVIAVKPPAKMADDVVKPGESTPPSTGTPGKPPVQPRKLHKLETAGKWRDSITGVGEWRAIQTSKLPVGPVSIPLPAFNFYCYHEKMGSDKTLTAHLTRHPYIVECVSWTAPKDDATQEASGKKFKVRNHHVQFDLAYVDGKLVTMNTSIPNVTVTEKPALPDTLGGAAFVKVTAPQAPTAPTTGGLVLDAVETRWLTKRQAAEYTAERQAAKDDAGRKAADDKYRAFVKAQIRPEASAAYAAAAALPAAEAPAKIKEAIEKIEMWGGAVSAVVAPFQEKPEPKLLEVQLSKAEYDVLKSSKNVAALRAYENARAGVDGNSGTNDKPEFSATRYDAVALHLAAEAARKAAGSTPPVVTPPGGGDEQLVPLLTEAEKLLLTPDELKNYNSIYDSAPKPKEKDKNLQAEAKRLRDLIAKEGRGQTPPYVAPTNRAEFDKLPDWQRRKFCSELKPSAGDVAGDARATDLGGSGKAKDQLQSSANAAAANGATTTTTDAPASDWTVDACKPYRTPPVTTNPGGGKPTVGADVPTPIGKDMENAPKEKSKWLTQDLLTSAAKGALVGLLIGSLFGPVGLIAGPLLGAATFYGLTKITS